MMYIDVELMADMEEEYKALKEELAREEQEEREWQTLLRELIED